MITPDSPTEAHELFATMWDLRDHSSVVLAGDNVIDIDPAQCSPIILASESEIGLWGLVRAGQQIYGLVARTIPDKGFSRAAIALMTNPTNPRRIRGAELRGASNPPMWQIVGRSALSQELPDVQQDAELSGHHFVTTIEAMLFSDCLRVVNMDSSDGTRAVALRSPGGAGQGENDTVLQDIRDKVPAGWPGWLRSTYSRL